MTDLNIKVVKRNGQSDLYSRQKIKRVLNYANKYVNLSNSEIESIINELEYQLYDGISTQDIQKLLIRTVVDRASASSPQYLKLGALLLLYDLYKRKSINTGISINPNNPYNGKTFLETIKFGVKNGVYDKDLIKKYSEEEIIELGNYLKSERDTLFNYAGLKVLSDRYLSKVNNEIIELPQEMYMLIAMSIFINESKDKRIDLVKRLYDALSTHKVSLATPILMNMRSNRRNYTSCFVLSLDDDLRSINEVLYTSGMISKLAGGLGLYIGKIRARNSRIQNFDNTASGIIPVVKLFNDMMVYVNQLGVRKGSISITLDIWHKDIFEFLEVKTNSGDERMKAHDIHPAVSIPDLFMKRLLNKEDFTLLDPYHARKYITMKFINEKFGNIVEETLNRRINEVMKEEIKTNGNVIKVEVDNVEFDKYSTNSYKDYPYDYKVFINLSVCVKNVKEHLKILISKVLEREKDYFGYIDTELNLNTREKVRNLSVDYIIDNLRVEKIEKLLEYFNNVEVDKLDKEKLEELLIILQILSELHSLYDYPNTVIFNVIDEDIKRRIIRELDNGYKQFDYDIISCENRFACVYTNDNPFDKYFEELTDKFYLLLMDVGYDVNTEENKYKEIIKKVLERVYDNRELIINVVRTFENEILSKLEKNIKFKVIVGLGIYGLGLEDFYGDEFEKWYVELEQHLPDYAKRKVNSFELWKRLLTVIFETGEPYVFFRDNANLKNPNKHLGTIYSSNLCMEIVQSMKPLRVLYEELMCESERDVKHLIKDLSVKEHELINYNEINKRVKAGLIPTCNLGAINLGNIDLDNDSEIYENLYILVRALDNVIDLTKYPTSYPVFTNVVLRPIGIGVMNYHYCLVKNNIKWESEEHLEFADKLFEKIAYYTIKASNELAKERGKYPMFKGSEWEKGIWFGRSVKDIHNESKNKLDWIGLYEEVKKYGLRNGYLLALMPTGSTSIITGATPSIDPIFDKFYKEENMSGILPQTPPEVDKYYWHYKSAYYIDQLWIIKAGAIRQKWIDQAQSLNIFITPENIDGYKLSEIYISAWKYGLKTVYYCRSKSLVDLQEECESCSV